MGGQQPDRAGRLLTDPQPAAAANEVLRGHHVLWPCNAGGRLAAHSARVPDPPFRWSGLKGPWFHNNLACLEVTPEGLKLWWQTGVVDDGDQQHPRLERVASLTLAPRSAAPARRL